MDREDEGWFSCAVAGAAPGLSYGFGLADGRVLPDPAARAQTGTVHGLSRLVDPGAHAWGQPDWKGRPWAEAVILELHIGTFTRQGTFRAAIERLEHLAETGITAIEIMPVAQFAGARGWGYDGVLPFAPHPAYGSPDDLKALVDAAHELGLMVLLDVVYNHFGPEGCYLHAFAEDFFHAGRQTPWGPAIAYEREPVRQFFVENALYWLGEFRFDGLRLDAVDHLCDPDSPVEILVEIARSARAAFSDRAIHLTTEDNRNITALHERGPEGAVPLYTAEWNDDLHNAAHVLATRETEGYYRDFADAPCEKFARALAEGFAYQGEVAPGEGAPRGVPSGHLPPLAFVDFLQNHDQIGNRAFGERLSTLVRPALLEVLKATLLLSPHVPLMFMGEEWGETRPFVFFCDFEGELAEAVRRGRRHEFRHFNAFQDPAMRATIPDPNALSSFEASRIDWAGIGRAEGAGALARTRDLLAIRHCEIVPRLAGAPGHGGKVIAAETGLVAIDWQLDGAVLRLRANFDDRPRSAPPAAGRLIHGAEASGELPEFSLRALIDAGQVA